MPEHPDMIQWHPGYACPYKGRGKTVNEAEYEKIKEVFANWQNERENLDYVFNQMIYLGSLLFPKVMLGTRVKLARSGISHQAHPFGYSDRISSRKRTAAIATIPF
jgi:hypothetical protein